jgi:hypothetical protein
MIYIWRKIHKIEALNGLYSPEKHHTIGYKKLRITTTYLDSSKSLSSSFALFFCLDPRGTSLVLGIFGDFYPCGSKSTHPKSSFANAIYSLSMIHSKGGSISSKTMVYVLDIIFNKVASQSKVVLQEHKRGETSIISLDYGLERVRVNFFIFYFFAGGREGVGWGGGVVVGLV